MRNLFYRLDEALRCIRLPADVERIAALTHGLTRRDETLTLTLTLTVTPIFYSLCRRDECIVGQRLHLEQISHDLATSQGRAAQLAVRLRTVAQALARYLRGSAMATQAQIVDLAAAAERSGDAHSKVKTCMSCGAPMPGEELLNLLHDYPRGGGDGGGGRGEKMGSAGTHARHTGGRGGGGGEVARHDAGERRRGVRDEARATHLAEREPLEPLLGRERGVQQRAEPLEVRVAGLQTLPPRSPGADRTPRSPLTAAAPGAALVPKPSLEESRRHTSPLRPGSARDDLHRTSCTVRCGASPAYGPGAWGPEWAVTEVAEAKAQAAVKAKAEALSAAGLEAGSGSERRAASPTGELRRAQSASPSRGAVTKPLRPSSGHPSHKGGLVPVNLHRIVLSSPSLPNLSKAGRLPTGEYAPG